MDFSCSLSFEDTPLWNSNQTSHRRLPPLSRQHREALQAIEDAQALILEAARLVSSIPGLADKWQELSGRTKETWHSVDAAKGKIER